MKVLKWMLYTFGVILLLAGGQDQPQPLLAWLGIGLIILGWRIGKEQKEEERRERRRMEEERRQAQQSAHPNSQPAQPVYISDMGVEEEEPDYESAAFLQYPIGEYYGDLSDEDDERLSNIDPIERDTVIEKERLFWDMMIFDDDE